MVVFPEEQRSMIGFFSQVPHAIHRGSPDPFGGPALKANATGVMSTRRHKEEYTDCRFDAVWNLSSWRSYVAER